MKCNKDSNWQAGFAPIVILLSALIVVSGIIIFLVLPQLKNTEQIVIRPIPSRYISPSVVPTINLDNDVLLYNNQELGFEFRYPKQGATIKSDSEDEYSKRGLTDFRQNFTNNVGYEPPSFIKAVAVLSKDNSVDLAPFAVWVFENPRNLDGSTWYDEYWYYPFMWGIFAKEHKYMPSVDRQATISGQLIKYRLLGYQVGAPEYFYFPHKGTMVLVRVLTEKNNGEQIFKTFKLINP